MKLIKNEEKDISKSNLSKKLKYVLSWNGTKPGQFFDKETYAGNIRGMVIFCLVVALSGHIDEINRWIGSQFGEELIVSPGKEAWHQVVARTMGIVGIIFTLINLQSIYAKRKKTALRNQQSTGADSIDQKQTRDKR